MINLNQRTHWIFDMDGTLTVAMHDFEAIRAKLGLPLGQPILETIAALPVEQATLINQRLDKIELDLANRAKAQPGARELLKTLQKRGICLGILTRNSQSNAYVTLQACALMDFFEPAYVLGRESAAPKPNPEGIHKLLNYWKTPPQSVVMVGDYLFDLQAGRQAGTATVYVDIDGDDLWTPQADLRVQTLDELLRYSFHR